MLIDWLITLQNHDFVSFFNTDTHIAVMGVLLVFCLIAVFTRKTKKDVVIELVWYFTFLSLGAYFLFVVIFGIVGVIVDLIVSWWNELE